MPGTWELVIPSLWLYQWHIFAYVLNLFDDVGNVQNVQEFPGTTFLRFGCLFEFCSQGVSRRSIQIGGSDKETHSFSLEANLGYFQRIPKNRNRNWNSGQTFFLLWIQLYNDGRHLEPESKTNLLLWIQVSNDEHESSTNVLHWITVPNDGRLHNFWHSHPAIQQISHVVADFWHTHSFSRFLTLWPISDIPIHSADFSHCSRFLTFSFIQQRFLTLWQISDIPIHSANFSRCSRFLTFSFIQ